MIVSKLLLVIILSVGVSVLNGAGQAGSEPTQVFTQLSAGSLILLMGGLAPWVAIKMFHFAGDSLYAAHATAAQGSAGGRSIVSAPRKVSSLQSQARSLTSSAYRNSPSGGGAAGPGHTPLANPSSVSGGAVRATTGASVASNAPATAAGVGTSTATASAGVGGVAPGGSAVGGTAAAGTAVAGAAVAGPVVAAVAAPVVVATGSVKAANTARAATIDAALGTVPEPPTPPKPSRKNA